jgi:hypothetical protein
MGMDRFGKTAGLSAGLTSGGATLSDCVLPGVGCAGFFSALSGAFAAGSAGGASGLGASSVGSIAGALCNGGGSSFFASGN